MTSMPAENTARRISPSRRVVPLAVAAILFAFAGTGCEFLGLSGDGTQQPAQPKQKKPTQKKKEKDKADAPETADDDLIKYQRPEYPNMSRRNPFQPDLEVVEPADLPDDPKERSLEPLERFSIGELDLVAIISEVAVPKAMFIDPEGFGHVLKEGDRIGRNAGVVSDIRDNEVEVTESSTEDQGQTRLRAIKLREVELRAGGAESLTEEERQALEKLLETEQGQEALERFRRDLALGASTVEGEGGETTESESQTTRPRDRRFPGIRPPSENQE